MPIKIKNLLLLAAAIFAAANNIDAQSFINTPNDTIVKFGMLEDLETLSIQQVNVGSKSIVFKWKKVSEKVPALWEAAVCDNTICNTTLVDSGIMNSVAPQEYGLILLHITPRINSGTAIVRYAVWDTANPLQIDTLTYILIVNEITRVYRFEKENKFNVFPNPSLDCIYITSLITSNFPYVISNQNGLEVSRGILSSNKVKITNLWNGIYFISIFNNDRKIETLKIEIQ